jgi:hypothetical protein
VIVALLAVGALPLMVAIVNSDRFKTTVTSFFGAAAEPSPARRFARAPLPPARTANLATAARIAGCRRQSLPDFGRGHTLERVRYRTNPPTSGRHHPLAAGDGAYAADNVPPVGQTVHALEHGRVDFQWRQGLPARAIAQLATLLDQQPRHTLLFQNQTGMRYAVAATAWRRMLTCPRVTPRLFDALRAFRVKYLDRGPETVP